MAQENQPSSAFPISDYTTTGDLLFISGTVSPGEKPFEQEAKEVIEKIGNHLKANGLTFNDLAGVTIYLKSMDNYAKFNEVYRTFFDGKFPSRTCIAVLDLPMKARVEISAIAKLKAAEEKAITYHQVDVFSDTPLTGNSLTVFLNAERFSTATMQKLTREMRHFESIFLHQVKENTFRARIFTMETELDFAGHPSLGAAATLHDVLKPNADKASCTLILNKKQVTIESQRTSSGYRATMNQGPAEFGKVLTRSEAIGFLKDLDLTENDWDSRYPLQVVTTGLPYLLVPLKDGRSASAKIVTQDLATKLQAIGAAFVGPFEVSARKQRTWDNLGRVEDVATGSLAGPVGAYLVKYKVVSENEPITIHQGEILQRPSELTVSVKSGSNEVFVTGSIVKIAKGEIYAPTAQEILAED